MKAYKKSRDENYHNLRMRENDLIEEIVIELVLPRINKHFMDYGYRLKPADERRERAVRRFESNTRRFIRVLRAGICRNGEDE